MRDPDQLWLVRHGQSLGKVAHDSAARTRAHQLVHGGRRVLVFTHEVVIVMWRYLLADLDERQALALSADHAIANRSLTRSRAGHDGALVLEADAWTAPMVDEHVPVTTEPDAPVAPR